MKKTRKQKRIEAHHWLNNLYTQKYMQKGHYYPREKNSKSFDLRWFRSNVLRMIRKNRFGEFPYSGRCACMEKGIFISFPDKRVSILKIHTSKR